MIKDDDYKLLKSQDILSPPSKILFIKLIEKVIVFQRAQTSILNLEMEDYENVRPEIPGLVETERTKKGKKKSNATSKKTLSLQNFLQEDSSQGSSVGNVDSPVPDPMESHFAKLNLDEEVLHRR